MYETIVFDLGGVLLEFSEQRVMDWFFAAQKEEDRVLLRRALYGGDLWRRHDRGDFTRAQMAAAVNACLPGRLHALVEDMMPRCFEPLTPIPETIALLDELKARGRRLYLLSNAPPGTREILTEMPFVARFDGIFISGEVGLLKPEPAIFQAFFARFGLLPETCFFIDDMPANIAGAAAAGMAGHCFDDRDVTRLRKALELSF